MIKQNKGICKKYGKEKWIQNSKGICPDCVYKLNHDGKSQQEVYLERQKKNKKKYDKTGEKELFLKIWQERLHYCANKNCRKWLGYVPKVSYFSHRKPKSTHPELRLNESNIDLLCIDCHYEWDFGDKSKIEL